MRVNPERVPEVQEPLQNYLREEEVEAMATHIEGEVQAGRMRKIPTPGFPGPANAPCFFVREKRFTTAGYVEKMRPVFDCSAVDPASGQEQGTNAAIDLGTLPFPQPIGSLSGLARDVRILTQQHGEPPLLFSLDLQNSYRQWPVAEEQRRFFRIHVKGQWYEDGAMAMGCRSSAWICSTLTSAIVDTVARAFKGRVRGQAYIDDCAWAVAREDAEEVVEFTYRLLEELGVKVKRNKTQGPDEAIVFLGFRINAREQTFELPKPKRQHLQLLLRNTARLAKGGKRLRVRPLRSLMGKLGHVASVYTPGRIFCRSIHERIGALLDGWVRLPETARADLRVWDEVIQQLPTRARFRTQPSLRTGAVMDTDACLKGAGGVLRLHGARSQLQDVWACALPEHLHEGVNVCIHEAIAVYIGLRRAVEAGLLQGKALAVRVDNTAVQFSLAKGGSSNAPLNRVVREIFKLCFKCDVQLYPMRISTSDNKEADYLSRLTLPSGLTAAPPPSLEGWPTEVTPVPNGTPECQSPPPSGPSEGAGSSSGSTGIGC